MSKDYGNEKISKNPTWLASKKKQKWYFSYQMQLYTQFYAQFNGL